MQNLVNHSCVNCFYFSKLMLRTFLGESLRFFGSLKLLRFSLQFSFGRLLVTLAACIFQNLSAEVEKNFNTRFNFPVICCQEHGNFFRGTIGEKQNNQEVRNQACNLDMSSF